MSTENEQFPVILLLANNVNTRLYILQMNTHRFLVLAQQFGAGQELVVLAEGDHWFRKLPQIELQQRGHRVHVRITTQKKTKKIKLQWKMKWKSQRDEEDVITWV